MRLWPNGKNMNLIEFSTIIANPSEISKGQTRDLSRMLDEFHFFQAGHFLHLYALKKQRSFRYNDALKKTAAYTTDRELLFDYITTFDFDVHAAPLNLGPKENAVSSEEQPDVPKDKQAQKPTDAVIEDRAETAADDSSEQVLGLGRPLEFRSDESFSFSEWLQLSELKPIDRSSEGIRSGSARKPKSSMDLINDFIAKSPRIKPSESESYEDMALESSLENEQLMTETLAHVYLEQKKYDKAIAAFTVLSLKYPEKSSFFADRIEAIKKIKNN